MDVNVKIKDGILTVQIPINKPLVRSQSGKTLVVASTHGNIEAKNVTVEGCPVVIGLNAYIKK